MKMIFHSISFSILFLISSSFTEQKAIPINIFFEPHFSCFLIFSRKSHLFRFPSSESALKEAKVNTRQKSWKFDEAKCEEALFHAIQLITDFYETWLRKFQARGHVHIRGMISILKGKSVDGGISPETWKAERNSSSTFAEDIPHLCAFQTQKRKREREIFIVWFISAWILKQSEIRCQQSPAFSCLIDFFFRHYERIFCLARLLKSISLESYNFTFRLEAIFKQTRKATTATS